MNTLTASCAAITSGLLFVGMASPSSAGMLATEAAPAASNVARGTGVSVSASSQNSGDGQTAAKATDGSALGYPTDYTREWATVGQRAGAWLQLQWASAVTVDHAVLYDRPNLTDQITGATLTFSDGSTVNVPALTNSGSGTTVAFPARSTRSLRLTVTKVRSGTANVGLAEIEAWGTPATPTPTPTPTPTSTPTPTPTPTPTTVLSLPRVAWEGGPAYWKRFSKADASGWDDPSFFPISVFMGKPDHAAQLKSIGINTYMAAEHDGSPVSKMTSQGMYVMAQQDEWTPAEVGNDPGVVSWFISDECEMGYSGCGDGNQYQQLAVQKSYVDKVNANNDGRFKHANFGNGVLQTWWGPDTMDDHVRLMDSSSADKYTYTSPHIWGITPNSPAWPAGATVSSAASYGWQADQMRKFQDPASPRPVWTFVETARPFLDEAGALTITPNQIEGAVWSAIIHEARGIAYFQHNNDGACGTYSLVDCSQTLRDRVAALNAQVKSLAPVINTQSYQYDFNNKTDTMLKVYGTEAYIFAGIGLLETPGSKTFTLPAGINGSTVTVVGENRTLPVVGGKFTDTFAAEYTHHIYRIPLS